MDEFLAWLELAEWQNQAKQKQERAAWGVRYGLATLKQCDYICQLYESSAMPERYDFVYRKAMHRGLSLTEYDEILQEIKEILNFNQPDPRQQIKRLFAAGTMF